MLLGFSAPYTPGGKSSIVPSPPWHYAGWVLSIEYEVDEAASAAYLPDGFGTATGRAAFHVAEWQATTDGSELLDPIYAQYRECFILLEAVRDGETVDYCPFIWVDQDVSLFRGLLQGLPKKIGSIWLTRSYGLDHPAAAPLRAGTAIGGTLASKDRRLAEAKLTLTGQSGHKLGLLARPTYGLLGLPSIVKGEASPKPRLVKLAAAVTHGEYHQAASELRFFDSPRDEIMPLAPLRTLDASMCNVAITIDGVVAVDAG
jgi:Acetoacetate decarboxylase (ADC)